MLHRSRTKRRPQSLVLNSSSLLFLPRLSSFTLVSVGGRWVGEERVRLSGKIGVVNRSVVSRTVVSGMGSEMGC